MRPGLSIPTGSKAAAGTSDCRLASSRRLSRKSWCAISISGPRGARAAIAAAAELKNRSHSEYVRQALLRCLAADGMRLRRLGAIPQHAPSRAIEAAERVLINRHLSRGGECLLLSPYRTCDEPAQRVRFVPEADIHGTTQNSLDHKGQCGAAPGRRRQNRLMTATPMLNAAAVVANHACFRQVGARSQFNGLISPWLLGGFRVVRLEAVHHLLFVELSAHVEHGVSEAAGNLHDSFWRKLVENADAHLNRL